jgi:hypothetical protein
LGEVEVGMKAEMAKAASALPRVVVAFVRLFPNLGLPSLRCRVLATGHRDESDWEAK